MDESSALHSCVHSDVQASDTKKRRAPPEKKKRERYRHLVTRCEGMIEQGLRLPEGEDEALPAEITNLCPPSLLADAWLTRKLRRRLLSVQKRASQQSPLHEPTGMEGPVLQQT